MLHLFKNNGYNIVLDVNSSSVHVVDDIVYDVLKELEEESADRYREEEFVRISEKISAAHPEEKLEEKDFREIFDAIQGPEENGTLSTDDDFKEGVLDFKKRRPS